MSPEQFAYWLQGYSEVHGRAPTEAEWKIIQDHLQLVFCKVTPAYPSVPEYPTYPAYPTSIPNVIC